MGLFCRSAKCWMFVLLANALCLAAGPDDLGSRTDQVFAAFNQPGSPGCALGVIRGGQFIYRHGYGLASIEFGAPITPETVFYIGSTSKQFTAASVILAAEQGYFSLDDDIRKYFPEMLSYGAPITIRHLLHHTSGLRDYLTLMDLAGLAVEDMHSSAEILQLIERQKELNFKTGDEYLYSNTGYFLLAQLIQRTTKKTLRQFAEENIFHPLGMKNTHFHDNREEIIKERAEGYAPGRDGAFRLNWSPNFQEVGSGGLLTTVDDLLLWDQNFYTNKLGKGSLLRELQDIGILNSGKKLDYASGLQIGKYRGLNTVSHGGALMGYRAELLRFPDQKFSVICLCNVATANPSRLVRKVADIYLADLFPPEPAKPKAAALVAVVPVSESELQAKAGTYRNPATRDIVAVGFSGGALSIQGVRLVAAGNGKFVAPDVPGLELEFSGMQIKAVTPDGSHPTFERLQPWALHPADLEDYAGQYFSDELQCVYKVVTEEGKLFLHRRGVPAERLEPTVHDEFQVGGDGSVEVMQFARNASQRVIEMTLFAGRVRNIRFQKR